MFFNIKMLDNHFANRVEWIDVKHEGTDNKYLVIFKNQMLVNQRLHYLRQNKYRTNKFP